MDYSKVVSSNSRRKKDPHNNQKPEEPNLLKKLLGVRSQDSTKNEKQRIIKPPAHLQNTRPNTSIKKHNDPQRPCVTFYSFKSKTIPETKEEKLKRLKEELINYESPFLWKPKDIKPFTEPRIVYQRLLQKDREIRDEKKFKWRSFILHLVMIYELYNMKELTKAIEKTTYLEDILETQQSGRDWFFMGIKDALWHVVQASKLFLCLEMDMIQIAEQLLRVIPPVKLFSRSNQAGLCSIRAAVFMEYGHRGNVKALQQIMKAVEIDRTVAEWHFLLGKSMRRIRRLTKFHDLVDTAEEEAFSRALELDKSNPVYILYVAQMLREKCLRQYKNGTFTFDFRTIVTGKEEYLKIKKTLAASFYKYKKAIEINPNCPHQLTRCALGIMKLPSEMVDLKFVKECIDKALELAPSNTMSHHVKGILYERYYGDINKALEEMEKAYSLGNFAAGMDLVKLHARMHEHGITEKLQKLAEEFEEPIEKQIAYAQAGSYCLFIEKDLVNAVKYFLKVIDIDDNSYVLKSHKPIFFPLKFPINVIYVVLVELKSNTQWQTFPKEEKHPLKQFLWKTSKHEEQRLKAIERRNEIAANTGTDEIEIKRPSKKVTMTKSEKNKKRKERRKENLKRAAPDEELTVEEVLRISQCRVKKFFKLNKKIDERRTNWLSGKRKNKGQKGNKSKKSGGPSMETNQFNTETSTPNNTNIRKQQPIKCTRDSSVSSVDSDYQNDRTLDIENAFDSHDSKMSHFKHASRYFGPQQNKSLDSYQPEPSQLTKENLKTFDHLSSRLRTMSISSVGSTNSSIHENHVLKSECDLLNPNDVTRQLGAMSISSVESLINSDIEEGHKETKTISTHSTTAHAGNLNRQMSLLSISSKESSNSSDSLSVMDRVKQSYLMLSYKSNNDQCNNRSKHLYKSDSLQHLNKNKKHHHKKDTFTKPQAPSFKGSTQSLNLQDISTPTKHIDSYKPSPLLRDTSVESVRSLTFMPNFGKK